MKTRNLLLVFLVITGAVLASDMFLVEDNTFFEPGEKDTVQAGEEVIAEATFHLDREAFCTILPAAWVSHGTGALHYLIIDQDTVFKTVGRYPIDSFDHYFLFRTLGSGEHTVQMAVFPGTILSNFVRLQVLVQNPSPLR